ncbi:MAG: transcriptional regulator [Candidatus Eremiobacter antarcticus]|nr:helix-turn-helix transcriptional regulator [Candidatus Eremiobacteraeota bacterium]MBC5808721.1 helix-turn-helix transcriptional regulator [Candidatus Eremiobacteraeota bacterium]PZR62249.1 MAG: transcriptional regulator [Candidatus Eremiobacter sp. RRmetagenome_bin22]
MAYSTKLVCPIQRTVAMIADKWKVIVIANLGEGTKRFRELQRAMQGVTPKVLTRQLRDLEHDGLVSRKAYAEVPPRVEYTLTPLGRSLLPVLQQLHHWAVANSDSLLKHSTTPDGEAEAEEASLEQTA